MINIEQVIEASAREFEANVDKVIERKRHGRKYCDARNFICWYSYRPEERITLKILGDHLGKRHHTTILYAIQKHRDLYETDVDYRFHCNRLLKELP